MLLVPQLSMPTEETRERLPERLTRNQAVHNIGRAALLIGALYERRYDLLNAATEDVLHQPARATIFEPMYPIFQAARDAGGARRLPVRRRPRRSRRSRRSASTRSPVRCARPRQCAASRRRRA